MWFRSDAQEIGTKWLGPEHQAACTYVSLMLAFRNMFKFALAVHRTPHAQGYPEVIPLVYCANLHNLALEQARAQQFLHHQMQVKRPSWSIEALCQVAHTHTNIANCSVRSCMIKCCSVL